MVNVLYVTETHLPLAGGVTTVVDQLAGAVTAQGGKARIIASGDDAVVQTDTDRGRVTRLPVPRLARAWMWSPLLAAEIKRWIAELPARVVHVHGVWMAPHVYGVSLANRLRAASIVSVHGMMEPWHWTEKGLAQWIRKQVYWYAVGKSVMRRADVVHAITSMERDNLRTFFPGTRIEVIPNAIELERVDAQCLDATEDRTPYLLFVGRLHRKKGIEVLLEAFARSGAHKRMRLLIAGTADAPKYEADLKRLADRPDLAGQVDFIGPLYGDRKWSLIRHSWALVAPSYSEVIGMVNLEAAACAVPTLTTFETGLEHWEDGGGVQIHPLLEELVAALKKVCSWSDEERRDRGRTMRRHVEVNYSWRVVWPRWRELYNEVEKLG